MKYTELIVAIENLLSDSTHLQMEQLKSLAQEYAQACQTVNAALTRAMAVLREGNLVEAVRICHTEHILDDFEILNFEARESWLEVVNRLTETTIPTLLTNFAEQLYGTELKVEDEKDLLDRHRLLAYSNGPMILRIQILRRLIAKNPKYFEWQKDLESYEKFYCDQLANEVVKITRLADITKIETDLSAGGWLIKIPASLIAAIQSRKDKLSREDLLRRQNLVLDDMKKIAAQLVVSYQRGVLPPGVEALGLWEQYVEKLKKLSRKLPPELAQKTAEPIRWVKSEQNRLAAEENYQRQLSVFSRNVALDNTPIETVQKMYVSLQTAARKINREVPPSSTEAMYRREKKHRERQFRKKVMTTLITLCLLAGLAAGGYFGWSFMQQKQGLANLKQNLVELKHLAEVHCDYSDALKYVTEVEQKYPEEAQRAEIHELLVQIKLGDRKNRERQEEFANLCGILREKIFKEKSIAPELKDELAKLQKLVRSADENTQYTELLAQYSKNQKDVTLAKDEAFEKEADELLAQIQKVKPESEDASEILAACSKKVKSLEEWPDSVSEVLKKQRCAAITEALDQKKEKIESLRKASKLQKEYEDQFEKLIAESRDLETYRANLEHYLAFVEENPSDEQEIATDEIKKRLEEEEIWNRIVAWNEFVKAYGMVMNYEKITPEQAKDFLENWDEDLLPDKEQEWNKTLLSKIEFLQKQKEVSSNTSQKKNISDLQSICNRMSVRDYWYAQKGKSKNWYYFLTNDGGMNAKYVVSWDDVSGESTPSDRVYNRDLQKSPHVKLCKSLEKTAKNLEVDFAENAPLLIEKILQVYADGEKNVSVRLDPLIAYYLLASFVDKLSDSNSDFKQAFEPLQKVCNRYDNLTPNRISPMRPNDLTRDQRDKAIRILESILEDKLFEKCEADFKEKTHISNEPCAGIYRMVGFLTCEGERFTIHSILSSTSLSGKLWVCCENSDFAPQLEFVEMGTIKKGVISTGNMRAHAKRFQYAPVFVFELLK